MTGLSKYISLSSNLDATFDNQISLRGSITNHENNNIPDSFSINSIYPNPFNPTTNIYLNVTVPGSYELIVYNLKGQAVYSTIANYENPGQYIMAWNANLHASGVYIATISNGSDFIAKKLTLLK